MDERLAAAAGAVRELEMTGERGRQLRARRGELARQLAALQARAAGEQHDVQRMEGVSLARVLASLRGAREDQLARERAEADAARYRVTETEGLLDAVTREEAAVQARLAQLSGAPERYARLLTEKERFIRESGDPHAPRLMDLAAERGRLAAERTEIAEALQAASAAGQALAQVGEVLGSASAWSAYDTFLGGRGISSSIKHSRLDQAAQAAAAADQHLAVLRTELADVSPVLPVTPRLPVEGLTRFADIWLDNFFTDMAVDARIREAQDSVARCAGLVEEVQAQLGKRDATVQASLQAIERERRDLLTQPLPPAARAVTPSPSPGCLGRAAGRWVARRTARPRCPGRGPGPR